MGKACDPERFNLLHSTDLTLSPAIPGPIEVLFEDNHCLALAKPAALLTQAPPGIPSLEAEAKRYLKEHYHKLGNVYLGIPHRLDRPVSGVVLFARSTKSARRLAEQFRERQVQKRYWALVDGLVEPAEGTWEDWLLKIAEEARSEVATEHSPGAKHAMLSYRKLAEGKDWTLLEIEPATGRMHQIRVQAGRRGWPVRGDRLYGSRLPFGVMKESPREQAIALHARSLTFLHPIRFEPVTVTAPLPAAWQELLGSQAIPGS